MNPKLQANYQPGLGAAAIPYDSARAKPAAPQTVLHLETLNGVRYLSKYLAFVNLGLPEGAIFTGRIETAEQRKKRLLGPDPGILLRARYTVDYVVHRVMPKLPLTKQAYFAITRGRVRVVSKAEMLGRLLAAGFTIVRYQEDGGLLSFTVQKTGAPRSGSSASYGPIFKMRRVGHHGRIIEVYKLRTMHPFAEYLQAFLYSQNNLHATGKFNDDFRVSTAGAFARRYWIDELPMLINWLKGELKLVGVRPLTEHYYSLYPEPLATRRKMYKPGLIPPYYVDLPKNFQEVLDSERKYLDMYDRHPWKADAIYFCRALYNIFVRGARSR